LSESYRYIAAKQTNVKYYDGNRWLLAAVKYYNGSTWRASEGAKYYNGTSWYIPSTPPLYTNVLKTAIDTNGSLYNGGKGYKDNYRLSSSSLPVSEKSATGWDITGYIRVKPGDIIRMKNITFYDIDNTGGTYKRTGIYGFNSSYSYVTEVSGLSLSSPLSWNVVTGTNGDVIQFTMTNAWAIGNGGYIRICAKDINDNSIITVNEEII
jgi:hypothetical protein